MNSRERIKKIFAGEIPDRVGIFDAPWPETVERWHREGLPKEVHVNEYFDYDIDDCLLLDTSLMLPKKIMEKTPEYMIYSDANGVVNKVMRGKTGAPLVLDYLIKTPADWEKYKKSLRFSKARIQIIRWGEYEPVDESNIVSSTLPWSKVLKQYQEARQKDKFMLFLAAGPLENATHLLDAQDVYMKMLTEPDFISDLFSTFTDLVIESYRQIEALGIQMDGFHFSDDIAYKNGMFFSPDTYRELLLPCHKRLCDFFRSAGLPVMYHTDGKLDEVLPLAIEAGITAIQPIEAKAGNDVRQLKARYEDIVFAGNIDVTKLSGTRSDVENEVITKIESVKNKGRYLYHSDHSVPPTVSFDNYKYALELVRKYGKY
ncbi:MAG: uroporphyrinogen decarboxylase family protein [Victivallaceae bacterium]|nr:uroporphyrinogen decarboxylase family protein [Victivallaceae bacterium]